MEVSDGLNDTYKRFIFHLMYTVQLTSSQRFDTQMEVHTSTHNAAVSLEQEFQKHLSDEEHKYVILDHGKHKKMSRKKR